MSNPSTIETAAPDGVWITIADLARRKNISRQSVSERVSRLESEGLIATRREGRSRLVELATFDRIVGDTGDAFREQGAETKRQDVASPEKSGPLRDAQATRAQYEAKLKALDFAERTGQLVPVKGEHGIETALIKVTELIVRDLNAPMNWIGEIMEAARGGEPALRRLLRKKIHEQRQTVANRMTSLAGSADEAEKSGVQVDIEFGD